MTESEDQNSDRPPLHGRVFHPLSSEELAEAVEHAFDYRGDITLELSTGQMVEGYLFNREATGPRPHLQFFPKNESGVREIAYNQIVTIAFSGEDTASGKSWEAWIAKKESQRRAEAEQTAEAAKTRGHL